MNKHKLTTITGILLTIAIALSSFVCAQTVQAATTYTDISGRLGDAEYLIRMPTDWNGKLVVFCHGYQATEPAPSYLVTQVTALGPLVTLKYAIALSSYGAGGYCVYEGMRRTHQLAEFILENYDVTGNVYLVGVSLGGNIALQLGAKYPELYSGVIDVCGSKDLVEQYNDKMTYVGIADNEQLKAAVAANGGVYPFYPFLPGYGYDDFAAFRSFSLQTATDIAAACGGTPTQKPKAYEKMSPTYSAVDIAVPTLTLQGTADSLVPYKSSIAFMNAVVAAGHCDIYRFYGVLNGKHYDAPLKNELFARFPQLVDWVENGNPAPDSVVL